MAHIGSFSLSKAFNDAVAALKENPGLVIGGGLVMIGIQMVLGLIPVIGAMVSMAVTAPLAGGFALFTMKLAGGVDTRINDIFSGFERFTHFLFIYLLWMALAALCAIPGVLLIGLAFALGGGEEPNSVLLGLGFAVMIVMLIALSLRILFAYYVAANAADGGSVKGAFVESVRITRGAVIGLLLAMLAIAVINFIGMLLLGIGVIITFPLTAVMFASIYLQLQDSADRAATTGGSGSSVF